MIVLMREVVSLNDFCISGLELQRFIVEPCSGRVFPFLGSGAAFPVAQTSIGTLIVFSSECEGFTVDKLLLAFVDTGCCVHE